MLLLLPMNRSRSGKSNPFIDRPTWLTVTIVVWLVGPGLSQEPGAEDIEFFENKIRPVLVEHCYECHGPEADPIEANLRLDSLDRLLKGGDSGPAVTPRDHDASLLLSALEYDAFEMPPSGKLPESTIAHFKTWIEKGAPVPASFRNQKGIAANDLAETAIDWEQARQHWAFQPIEPLTKPTVKEKRWNVNPIDAFVYHRLAQEGLQPSGPANRHTLVRRVYLNLVGIPPTIDQVDTFVNDDSPDAYEQLVERLLASPRYGERWGRHWLDVVRYADSNGADENHPYPFAWRYRNYVIDAFNQDLPYDQFLIEQLAGDLLPSVDDHEQNNRRLAATTFLAMGIKIDAEQDQEKKRADIIDEQLDTMGRSLLGMTIGCARCHDHKFDPIPTRDYYALSGILRSTNLENRKLGSDEADQAEHDLASTTETIKQLRNQERERIIAASRDKIKSYVTAARQVRRWQRRQAAEKIQDRLDETIKGSRLMPVGEILDRGDFEVAGVWLDAESFNRGDAAIDNERYGAGIGIVSDKGGGETWVEYDIDLPQAGLYQVEFRYAAENPRPGKLSVNGQVVHEASMAEVTGSWMPDTQTWFVEGRFQFEQGPNVLRFEVTPNMSHLDQLIVAQVTPAKRKQKEEAPTDPTDPIETPREIATREKLDLSVLLAWSALIRNQDPSSTNTPTFTPDQLLAPAGPLADVDRAEPYFAETIRQQLAELREKMAELEKQQQALNEPQLMVVAEGTPADAAVFIRGNHRQSGPVVPRRFLTVVSGEQQEPYPADQSGRLQLARSIASADNPLTARVMANRVWRWHLGRGIVESTDNFGLTGATPTHPELLDFLAQYLVDHDWSIKALHRLILSSQVYRMAHQNSEQAATIDPENRLLWRWPRRRMEAELLRDSLLHISGKLDTSTGQASVGHVTTANPSPTDLDNNQKYYEESPLRSVYLPIVRTNVFKFFRLFDFPNPAAPKGNRDATTVPTQALFLMNSNWVRQLASEWAEQVTAEETSPEKRIEKIYLAGLGRLPSRSETELARQFIEQEPDPWPVLCHGIFMLNEFMYIE